MSDGNRTAAWILLGIGIASIAYGIYRTVAGRDDNIVLFGVGAMIAVLGGALLGRAPK